MRNPFGGQPMMMMMPPFAMQGQQQQETPNRQEIIPARVNKAFEFLSILNHKTMDRGLASDSLTQVIDGETLSFEEVSAQCTALDMLSKYFSGKLTADPWERVVLDAANLETSQAALEHQQQQMVQNKTMKIIGCVMCGANPKPECPLCEGNGTLIVMSGPPRPKQQQTPPNQEQQIEAPAEPVEEPEVTIVIEEPGNEENPPQAS